MRKKVCLGTLTEGRKFVYITTLEVLQNNPNSWLKDLPGSTLLHLPESSPAETHGTGTHLIHQLVSLVQGAEFAKALGRPLQSIMIEGGAKTLSLFLRAGFADLLHVFLAPMLSGGDLNRIKLMQLFADSKRFELISTCRLGPDTVIEMISSQFIGQSLNNMEKFICVGKNYTDHIKEMANALPNQPAKKTEDAISDKPVLFLKPPSSGYTIENGGSGEVILPKNRGIVHFECEIILRLDANAEIEAVSLGLDMTLRDVQANLKKQGLPWELAKVFKHSAIIGPWIPINQFPTYLDEPFTFSLEGKMRQSAKGNEMRTLPDACLSTPKRCSL